MTDIELLDNIKIVYKKIADSTKRSERAPEEVKLIAVTKNVETDVIKKAVETGLREFGENRVQEAQKKVTSDELQVTSGRLLWHLIGHLQKNKAKIAVQLFDLIHSVDSSELAEVINKQAEKMHKIQRILVQVKLSDEESKHGVTEDNLFDLFGKLDSMRNLKTDGLMTMPPYFDDPERSRQYFTRLRELKDRLESSGYKLPELSMGMSNDFEVAINEGATMIRVGTAIFGERLIR